MKRLILIISALAFSLTTYAQKDFGAITIRINQTLEDSDLLVNCNDYYSGKFIVRSGNEVYQLNFFSGFGANCLEIFNERNEIKKNGISAYDRKTGEALMPEYMVPMKIDWDCLEPILHEVFPLCSFKPQMDKDKNRIRMDMKIDPDTFTVIEVNFVCYYPDNDRSIFSLPPSKIRQLETLIKKRIVAEFPMPIEHLHESRRNASYQIAFCGFSFTELIL